MTGLCAVELVFRLFAAQAAPMKDMERLKKTKIWGLFPPRHGATVTYYADFTDYNTAIGSSDWATMAVPEPTSGLLMLIGMGGLALKRKKA